MDPIRPCERQCKDCGQWLHFSRFRQWKDKRRHGSMSAGQKELCKACEQKKRNEKKNLDRARSIIEDRAVARARKLGVSKAFMWIDINWKSLVPMMRAMMTPEGLCLSCGHPFVNERDIQIEHREPPRSLTDWARESARNIGLLCQSCNVTKQDKPHSQWLDEQEAARISNAAFRAGDVPIPSSSTPAMACLPGLEGFNSRWALKK